MANLTVVRGSVSLDDSLPFAVTHSGQTIFGSFTSDYISVQLPEGGTGTYYGNFSYAGNAIVGSSRFFSYAHDSSFVEYYLSGPTVSITVSAYLDYMDSGDRAGLVRYFLRGADVITGGASGDVLMGYNGNDRILGGAGDDELEGGAGKDTLIGGVGDDLYVPTEDTVVEESGGGTDTVISNTSYTLKINFERLFLSASGDAKGTGNGSANDIFGNGGDNELLGMGANDTLRGSGGDDTLKGGTGNDRLDGSSGNDVYFLLAGEGSDTIVDSAGKDTVRTSLNNYTLGAKLENLVQLGTTKLTSTGNSLGNEMTGNGGHSRLRGGDGNDLLKGGLGNDTLEGQDHADTLNGEAGTDSLSGGSGNDTLDGGTGKDRLLGGTGDDTFKWDASTEDAVIKGEGGSDTLRLSGTAGLDLATVTTNITGVDVVLLAGTNTLELDAERVMAISDGGTLRVNGGGGDQVTATDAWVAAGTTTVGGALYDVYTSGDATLHIRDGIAFDYLQLPVITSDGGGDSASVSVDENGELATTVISAAMGVTYSITGGDDAALFTIDASSGELTFNAGPDFENPADADTDNVYEVIVQAANSAGTDAQTMSVTVSDSPAPVITSDGGGASAGVVANDEDDYVTTVAATNAAITYSITGGDDAEFFTIDATSGELSFDGEIDFESPADADADNVYEVTVQAADPEGADEQAISVTVNDGPPPPPPDDVSASGPNGHYVFSPGDFFGGDFQAIKLTDNVYYGNLWLGANPISTGFVAYSDIEAGQLVYRQSSDNAGALGFSDSFSFQVKDSLGNVDPTIYSLSIGLMTWFGHNLTTDAFTGGDAADTLAGLALSDTLSGGGGDDSIWGGEDGDRLTGGPGSDFIHPGADTFTDLVVYNAINEGGDFIVGFTPSEDSVVFAGTARTALDDNGTAGTLNFVTNANVNLTNGAGSDGCLITAAVSGITDAELLDLSAVAGEIMTRTVTAAAGHDGLFVIQAEFDTGVYYYAENGDATNDVSAAELTRLAVFDQEWLDTTDFLLG